MNNIYISTEQWEEGTSTYIHTCVCVCGDAMRKRESHDKELGYEMLNFLFATCKKQRKWSP